MDNNKKTGIPKKYKMEEMSGWAYALPVLLGFALGLFFFYTIFVEHTINWYIFIFGGMFCLLAFVPLMQSEWFSIEHDYATDKLVTNYLFEYIIYQISRIFCYLINGCGVIAVYLYFQDEIGNITSTQIIILLLIVIIFMMGILIAYFYHKEKFQK